MKRTLVAGLVRVSYAEGDPIVGAAVTTEWLGSWTLEVIVKNVGSAPIENSWVELSVRYGGRLRQHDGHLRGRRLLGATAVGA